MRKNQLVTGGFQYDFTESQLASFTVERVTAMSSKQAKTLSLVLSSAKKKKIVKTIGACTERFYLLL
jgi:hypothetical protein